ncbi:MAG: hypothetical protein ABJA34_12300 [Pseudonocardiales bacterium]
MPVNWEMHYDRRVPRSFLAHFLPGGVAASLAEYARHAPYPVDLQMRHDPRTGAHHATLYVGLTDVLTVKAHAKGLVLRPHKVITGGPFALPPALQSPAALEVLKNQWRAVEIYLDRVIPLAAAKHASKEGVIQAAASTFLSDRQVMVDRELAVHFLDDKVKKKIMGEITRPVVAVVQSVSGIPGQRPDSFGGECDLLGVDKKGRLLAVEIKPADVGSIRWAAAQATVYAEIVRRWVTAADLPAAADVVLNGMLNQRAALGLGTLKRPVLGPQPQVVPAVALPTGVKQTYLYGLLAVRTALIDAGHPPVDVYELTLAGRPDQIA